MSCEHALNFNQCENIFRKPQTNESLIMARLQVYR